MSYIPSLPFDWVKHFVPDRSSDCFPACIAMTALYWKGFSPELNISTDIEFWKKYIDKYKVMNPRGSSIKRVYESIDAMNKEVDDSENISGESEKLTTKRFDLKIETYSPVDLRNLGHFLEVIPQIPAILIFDRALSLTNVHGGYHAVILHSIDFKKEKISYIDPSLTDLGEPFRLDLERFNIGWGTMQNLVISVYPKTLPITINTNEVVIDRSMDEFLDKGNQ